MICKRIHKTKIFIFWNVIITFIHQGGQLWACHISFEVSRKLNRTEPNLICKEKPAKQKNELKMSNIMLWAMEKNLPEKILYCIPVGDAVGQWLINSCISPYSYLWSCNTDWNVCRCSVLPRAQMHTDVREEQKHKNRLQRCIISKKICPSQTLLVRRLRILKVMLSIYFLEKLQ